MGAVVAIGTAVPAVVRVKFVAEMTCAPLRVVDRVPGTPAQVTCNGSLTKLLPAVEADRG